MTETLTKLPAALAKFQAEHHAAGRDGKGNYGTYTTLAGALAAVQHACAFGLSHTQTLQPISDDLMVLRTTLMHESGEAVVSDLPLPIRQEGGRGNPMQALGSALTYARRYGLLAIYGIAGDDDDGEGAAPAAPAAKPQTVKKPATPAQTSKPAATKQPSPEPAPAVEPPLASGERDEILAVLRELFKSNRSAFDAFNLEYRATFNVPETVKTSDHIQTKQHGDFAQQFFASLPPA
ncbi:MAG: ERF family protein [Cyanobium sp. 49614_E6]|nr:ERF family protein [Cyanobium sp. 49614_E6]